MMAVVILAELRNVKKNKLNTVINEIEKEESGIVIL